jgi:hypothetical protein
VDEEHHESLKKPVKPKEDEYVPRPVNNGPEEIKGPEGSNVKEEEKDFFVTIQENYMHPSQG